MGNSGNEMIFNPFSNDLPADILISPTFEKNQLPCII